ncbi:MAG: phosphoribosylformylglycinamidine synthase subunit PurL [Thermovirgaceae bacterium]
MNYRKFGLRKEEYEIIRHELGREPNEAELRIMGVMWSEHCSYKSTKALLKNLPSRGEHVIQGPGENAGIVDIGDGLAIAFKVESHNHPSAVAPYQGAATGVGGIIRDVLAMGAWPMACMDGLFFGDPSNEKTAGLMQGVVSGIGGYGNAVGVPTVGGKTGFDDCYDGNPLVNAMCVGLVRHEKIIRSNTAKPGHLAVLLGSRTGRDGIAGAAFASAGLEEDTKESRPQVQIGDPFVEKLVIECCHELIDLGLIISMQDMGAAGITSSASEVAAKSGTGVVIEADQVPLREPGMNAWEIALSESQERMLLIIDASDFGKVEESARKWNLECAVIGKMTDDGRFRMTEKGKTIVDLSTPLVGGGCPEIRWPFSPSPKPQRKPCPVDQTVDWKAHLLDLLSSFNLRDKSPIYEQYDHMVQINTVAPPGGPVSVIRIKGMKRMVALTMDSDPWTCDLDPFMGGAETFMKASRPLSVCGAKLLGATDCLNYPSPEKPENFWALAESVEGLAAAARAMDCPVVSGNVSLYNESPGRKIYPSPVVGLVGLLGQETEYLSHGSWKEGDTLFLVGPATGTTAGSMSQRLLDGKPSGIPWKFDARLEKTFCKKALETAHRRLASSGRAIAGGGLSTALAKESVSSGIGARIEPKGLENPFGVFFGEGGPRAVYAVSGERAGEFCDLWASFGCRRIGHASGKELCIEGYFCLTLDDLLVVWKG